MITFGRPSAFPEKIVCHFEVQSAKFHFEEQTIDCQSSFAYDVYYDLPLGHQYRAFFWMKQSIGTEFFAPLCGIRSMSGRFTT